MRAKNSVKMEGRIYNSWRVLEYSHTNNKVAYFKCECVDCGTQHIVRGGNVRNGRSKRCAQCGLKSTFKTQTGVKKSKKTSKQLAESYLYIDKKKDAKKRKKAWALTIVEFISIIYQNCHYCGVNPSTTVNPTTGRGLEASRAQECFITYNGIDRVDSSKGYEIGNVVPCCEQCNRAKLDYTASKFIDWAKRLVAHQNSSK